MDSYSRKLKYRLVWWRIWWSFCVIAFMLHAFGVIDMLRHPEYYTDINKFFKSLWFFVFTVIAFGKAPGKRKLLAKDLRKDRKNIYAKATLLEMKVAAKRKAQAEKDERVKLEEKIKGMREELGKVE